MKTRYILSAAPLLPLVILVILAMVGITLNVWVYLVLVIVCPLVAGTIWVMSKGVEKKIKNAETNGQ